jgi:hypothetical protein
MLAKTMTEHANDVYPKKAMREAEIEGVASE